MEKAPLDVDAFAPHQNCGRRMESAVVLILLVMIYFFPTVASKPIRRGLSDSPSVQGSAKADNPK